MHVRAVEPAVDLRELVVHVADLEVAPLAIVLAAPGLDVELAERRRHLLDRAVVAERREVVVGIDAAKQRVRRLVQEVAEEIRQRLVARVGARREVPAFVELAVDEEREPRVGRRVEVVGRVLALQQLDRAVRVVAVDGQVGHADVEPVVALELDVAQIQIAVALLVENRHLDRVHAGGQDLLRDEIAFRVERHLRGPPRIRCAPAEPRCRARSRSRSRAECCLGPSCSRRRRRAARRPRWLSAPARARVTLGASGSAYGAPAVVSSARSKASAAGSAAGSSASLSASVSR